VVELAESLEEESLLLLVGERKSLDDLSGMVGASLESRGGNLGADGSGALGDGLSGLSLVVGNREVEDLSEGSTLLGLALLSGEAVSAVLGVTLSGSVVEAGEVKRIVGEALTSRLGTLLSDDKGRVVLGEIPENAGWDLHVVKPG
jgi:hypothetical protein